MVEETDHRGKVRLKRRAMPVPGRESEQLPARGFVGSGLCRRSGNSGTKLWFYRAGGKRLPHTRSSGRFSAFLPERDSGRCSLASVVYISLAVVGSPASAKVMAIMIRSQALSLFDLVVIVFPPDTV